MRQKFGTTKIDSIRKKHPNVEHVKQNSKGRYFAFRGSKKSKKENKKSIDYLIKKYPKRKETNELDVLLVSA